ncbi:unnamed protein product [Rhizophagus irregularis]|nr:unnamed protein product [Rhizophagus irregularis]
MDNINEINYNESIKYNSDNTVNVPFGRAADWYINNIPMLKVCRLKHQSRQKTPQLAKEGFIEIERAPNAVDFLEWETKQGAVKSTNRIDDIVILTTKGQELFQDIQLGLKKDRTCWYWTMYCSGDGNNCQRTCGGVGECLSDCQNKGISIQGSHLPHNFTVNKLPHVTRINLDLSTRDMVLKSRRADHHTAKGIKMKMLAPLNGASEETIREALNNKQRVCSNEKLRKLIARDDKRFKDNAGPWTILHNMVEKILKPNGFVLYYQIANPHEPEDSPARYYQLTVSDEFWLRNGRDFGKICIGLDGKYDLNIDRAPVLSIVVENNASCGTPLAFTLSNKENHMTIRMAVSAVKQNIPCNNNNCEHNWYYEDLHDAKGFKRICPCSQNNLWNPYMMIDKHRPSKLGIEGLTCGAILCWFHIMQTLGNHLKEWQIPQQFRYPIASHRAGSRWLRPPTSGLTAAAVPTSPLRGI